MESNFRVRDADFFLTLSSDDQMRVCFGTKEILGVCLQTVDELPSQDDVMDLLLEGTWVCVRHHVLNTYSVIHEGQGIASYGINQIPVEIRPESILCYKLMTDTWVGDAKEWAVIPDKDPSVLTRIPLKFISQAPES